MPLTGVPSVTQLLLRPARRPAAIIPDSLATDLPDSCWLLRCFPKARRPQRPLLPTSTRRPHDVATAFDRKEANLFKRAFGAVARNIRRPERSATAVQDQVDLTTDGRRSSSSIGFVDTHCHLDMILPRLVKQNRLTRRKAEALGKPAPSLLKPTFESWRSSLSGPESGFEGCVNIGCAARSLDAAAAFLVHEGVHGAFGIHPLYAEDWNDEIEQKLLNLMALDKVVAWGECGLDYFDKNSRGQINDSKVRRLQRSVFARQLQLAVELGMPIVVHTRSAEEDTLELLSKHVPVSHPIHVHCFTSSLRMAKDLLAEFPQLYIGFTGVVTFKNAPEVREVVSHTPLERLLLETDGPYMAPEPCRGQVAHPGHVAYVAQGVARAKGLPTEEVLKVCRENARQIYGF